MRGDAFRWSLDGYDLPVHALNTLVVGSGAAARNAALQLHRRGVTDIAIVTERWNAGTSFNAGSDKQTYYKLSLSGRDSARELANDLWAGGCMHGDIALCEANGSAQAFLNLVDLGVPFPHDRHGGYPGYRTDNDRRGRATSAGPLTSRLMCEHLGRELERIGVRVFDRHQVVALLTRHDGAGQRVIGAVAMEKDQLTESDFGLVVFNARNVILATGGPGGMYRDSVYPQSQRGAMGMALRAGAIAHNLTESQFGLASIGFRWNLSGSYQQVIPRYVSTSADGGDERDFLNAHFPDMATLAAATFRKGYEWPFDAGRVTGHGSSLIDLLVHRETRSGRRVFLDYTRNPQAGDGVGTFDLDAIGDEAGDYLRRSGALADAPIARLMALNEPAIRLFRDHGIDLAKDRLEVAVCAQHNNGGLRAGIWWESNLRHLFPIGEICGTHGVRRPGGAALNAGQVGGMRAALFIAEHYAAAPPDVQQFTAAAAPEVQACLRFCEQTCGPPRARERSLTPATVVADVQERMSRYGAHVRHAGDVCGAAAAARQLLDRLPDEMRVRGPRGLNTAFWAADLCLTHYVYLEAIRMYLDAGGISRGSVMVLDRNGVLPLPGWDDSWRFAPGDSAFRGNHEILEIRLAGESGAVGRRVPVRPVPDDDGWFEEVWREYRAGRIVTPETGPGEAERWTDHDGKGANGAA